MKQILVQQEAVRTTWVDQEIKWYPLNFWSKYRMQLVSEEKLRMSFKIKKRKNSKRATYIVFKAKSRKKLLAKLQKWESDQRRKIEGIGFPKVEANPVYVPKRIMDEFLYVCDLFCIPEEEIPELRIYPKVNNLKGWCYYKKYPQRQLIKIGALGGVSMTTIIHELTHAIGYKHQKDINGYSHYSHYHHEDQWSRLVCKDIYGKREVIIN